MSTYSNEVAAPTAWVGWFAFAGILMVLVGFFHAVQGLVAVFDEDYYIIKDSGLVVTVDYTTWGWVHLLAGLVVAAAGFALFLGKMWARVIGVALAVLSAVLNFTFIAAYPFWSTIVIALDIFVILALTVHGRDMAAVQGAVSRSEYTSSGQS